MRLVERDLILLMLIFCICTTARALDISEIPRWNGIESYSRGSLVRYKTKIKIALIPSTNKRPSKKIYWRTVRINSPKPFKPKKLYLPGRVVQLDEDLYIAIKISAPKSFKDLHIRKKWILITNKAGDYVLPEYSEEEASATLIGLDNNLNRIRDDYEKDIILSELPDDVKENALNAGKAYGEMFRVGTSNNDLTMEDVHKTLQSLLYAKQCKKLSKALNNGKGWRESDFYNTVNRIEAKFNLQKTLYEFVGNDKGFDLRNPSPCQMLKEI